jgi:malonyl-CoA O-methyltransferase
MKQEKMQQGMSEKTPEKALVRNAFARAASHYDAVADFQREAGERLVDVCQDFPAIFPSVSSAQMQVLDAGCGTGHGLQLIARQWPQARTVALDFAEPMLLSHSVTIGAPALTVCGDIEMLPLATASVDLVWSSLAMQWCDTSRVAQEFHRVLKHGGYLAATTLGPGTFAELRRAFAGVDEFRHTNDFIDETRLRSTLGAAGFGLLVLQRVAMQRHYPDLRSLLASVRELGASHVVSKNRRPGLMGKTAWRHFTDNYEQMRTAHGLPLTYDTYFIVARNISRHPPGHLTDTP